MASFWHNLEFGINEQQSHASMIRIKGKGTSLKAVAVRRAVVALRLHPQRGARPQPPSPLLSPKFPPDPPEIPMQAQPSSKKQMGTRSGGLPAAAHSICKQIKRARFALRLIEKVQGQPGTAETGLVPPEAQAFGWWE